METSYSISAQNLMLVLQWIDNLTDLPLIYILAEAGLRLWRWKKCLEIPLSVTPKASKWTLSHKHLTYSLAKLYKNIIQFFFANSPQKNHKPEHFHKSSVYVKLVDLCASLISNISN